MVYGKVKDEVGMASLVLTGLNSRSSLEFMGHRTLFPVETILMLDLRSSMWKNLAHCRTGIVKRRKTGSEVIVLREARLGNYTPEHKEWTTPLFWRRRKDTLWIFLFKDNTKSTNIHSLLVHYSYDITCKQAFLRNTGKYVPVNYRYD